MTAADLQAALEGRYVIRGPLAPGGQAAVFRATRIASTSGQPTADDVALKVYGHHVEVERVEREVVLMTGVRHRCLPTLLEHDTVFLDGAEQHIVAWEFVAGAPLADRIAAGRLPQKDAARIGRDISEAIRALWGKRVVHRDVKPQNIMLRASPEEAVLVDLGAARHLDAQTLTEGGYTLGTRGYLSPEQMRGEHNLTCKSDIYSLGVVLLECLGGRHPTAMDQRLLTRSTLTTTAIAPLASARLANLIDAMVLPRAAHRPSPEAAAFEFDHIYRLL